ncbi:MAG: 30S ribosome-binding factor RbfA [Vicinamibacterales bacterium]
MQGSRPARLGEQIREDLSAIVQSSVRDPGIGFVTFTYVNVSADLQVARVYYTTLGDDRARRDTAKALGRATPFLRRQLASRLRLRHAPELHFHFDESVARGLRVEELLREIQAETRPADPDQTTGAKTPDVES